MKRPKKLATVRCKDCDEEAVQEKEPGLYECLACGRMFTKKPAPLPAKIAGNWGKKK